MYVHVYSAYFYNSCSGACNHSSCVNHTRVFYICVEFICICWDSCSIQACIFYVYSGSALFSGSICISLTIIFSERVFRKGLGEI